MDRQQIALREQSRLQERLRGIPWIESATLIGKPVQSRVERVLDLDNVVVVDKLTEERYRRLQSILDGLKNSTPGVDVMYAIADGPMKPPSEKESEVFFHICLHTLATYKDSPLQLVKNSWQYEQPYLGKPLCQIQNIPTGVTKDVLLHGLLGVGHLGSLVCNNESAYLGWEKAEDGRMAMRLIPLKFKEIDERLELYFYSILRSASNTLRWMTGNNEIGIDSDICGLFRKTCHDFEHKNLPQEVYVDKRLMRNRKLILTEGFAQRYQMKAIEFLNGLEQYVQEHVCQGA